MEYFSQSLPKVQERKFTRLTWIFKKSSQLQCLLMSGLEFVKTHHCVLHERSLWESQHGLTKFEQSVIVIATIWEKAISLLTGNLNFGRSYNIATVHRGTSYSIQNVYVPSLGLYARYILLFTGYGMSKTIEWMLRFCWCQNIDTLLFCSTYVIKAYVDIIE